MISSIDLVLLRNAQPVLATDRKFCIVLQFINGIPRVSGFMVTCVPTPGFSDNNAKLKITMWRQHAGFLSDTAGFVCVVTRRLYWVR
jgi:hypothetical protein